MSSIWGFSFLLCTCCLANSCCTHGLNITEEKLTLFPSNRQVIFVGSGLCPRFFVEHIHTSHLATLESYCKHSDRAPGPGATHSWRSRVKRVVILQQKEERRKDTASKICIRESRPWLYDLLRHSGGVTSATPSVLSIFTQTLLTSTLFSNDKRDTRFKSLQRGAKSLQLDKLGLTLVAKQVEACMLAGTHAFPVPHPPNLQSDKRSRIVVAHQ